MKIYTLTKLIKFGSAYEIANEICNINECHKQIEEIAETIIEEHGFDVQIKGEQYTVTEYVSEEEENDNNC